MGSSRAARAHSVQPGFWCQAGATAGSAERARGRRPEQRAGEADRNEQAEHTRHQEQLPGADNRRQGAAEDERADHRGRGNAVDGGSHPAAGVLGRPHHGQGTDPEVEQPVRDTARDGYRNQPADTRGGGVSEHRHRHDGRTRDDDTDEGALTVPSTAGERSEQHARAPRAAQHAVPGGTRVERVPHEEDVHDVHHRAERDEDGEHDEQHDQHRVVTDDAVAAPVLRVLGGHVSARADEQAGTGNDEERRGVDEQRHVGAVASGEDAADDRRRDRGHRTHRLRKPDRTRQLLRADDAGQQCLPGRAVHRLARAERRHQDEDGGQRMCLGQHGAQHGLGDARPHQQSPAVVSIDDDAGQRGEHHQRHQAGREQNGDRPGARATVVQTQGQRDEGRLVSEQ